MGLVLLNIIILNIEVYCFNAALPAMGLVCRASNPQSSNLKGFNAALPAMGLV